MSVVVLDTDAASVLHRGRLEPALARHLAGRTLALTFVTVGELHKGMALRNWGERRRVELEVPLLTLNRSDFEDFARHDGLVLLGSE